MVTTEQRLMAANILTIYVYFCPKKKKIVATKSPRLLVNHNPGFWHGGLEAAAPFWMTVSGSQGRDQLPLALTFHCAGGKLGALPPTEGATEASFAELEKTQAVF